jgi:hypothetical protein
MLSFLAQYIRIGYETGLACYESEIGDAFNLKIQTFYYVYKKITFMKNWEE